MEGEAPKNDEKAEKVVDDEEGASAAAAAAAAGGDCPDEGGASTAVASASTAASAGGDCPEAGDDGGCFANRSSPFAMLERRRCTSDSAFVALTSASAFASLHRLTSSPNRSISAL